VRVVVTALLPVLAFCSVVCLLCSLCSSCGRKSSESSAAPPPGAPTEGTTKKEEKPNPEGDDIESGTGQQQEKQVAGVADDAEGEQQQEKVEEKQDPTATSEHAAAGLHSAVEEDASVKPGPEEAEKNGTEAVPSVSSSRRRCRRWRYCCCCCCCCGCRGCRGRGCCLGVRRWGAGLYTMLCAALMGFDLLFKPQRWSVGAWSIWDDDDDDEAGSGSGGVAAAASAEDLTARWSEGFRMWSPEALFRWWEPQRLVDCVDAYRILQATGETSGSGQLEAAAAAEAEAISLEAVLACDGDSVRANLQAWAAAPAALAALGVLLAWPAHTRQGSWKRRRLVRGLAEHREHEDGKSR
jgi:hypothetical protein